METTNMTTATKPAKTLDAFRSAYEAATGTQRELREAYEAYAGAQRAMAIAVAEEREAARVAFVQGREHEATGELAEAQAKLVSASARADELRAEDQAQQQALADAICGLLDAGGRDAFADAVGQLIDAGAERMDRAMDEAEAARRQLAKTLGMLGALDGKRVFGEANGMTVVQGLVRPNGDAFSFGEVEDALRAMGAAARDILRGFMTRPEPPKPPRVSVADMLAWHIAAGGSYSDSTSEVREHYLEHGPRRNDAAMDAQDQDTGRTRDQRTWL
jgi:hypothetical protein